MTCRKRLSSARHGQRRSAILLDLAVCVLSFALAACNDLLTASNPDIVKTEDLTGPGALAARRAGAFGDFVVAYGGNGARIISNAVITNGQVTASGLLSDEYKDAGQFPALDGRRLTETNSDLTLFYAALHRAREAAEQTSEAYLDAGAVPGADVVIAEMMILAGFSYTFFAESFCSGVPVSHVTKAGDVEYGQPLTTQEILQRAGQRFDEALARATTAANAELQNVARVGKGRALLNLGQFAQAATAVTAVPSNFRYLIRHSANTPRQGNAVFFGNNLTRHVTVADREGINGIDYRGAFTAGDPRTPFVVNPAGSFDRISGTQYDQQLYTSATAPIPLATGIEARLIEAEAALQAGQLSQFDAIHNQLRATLNAAAVGPISSAGMTMAERVDFHFRERALWMWLTGHRLGDMRRLVRQYGRAVESVFPTGPYFKATYPTYGTQATLPIPDAETNNPNFTGCLDRNP